MERNATADVAKILDMLNGAIDTYDATDIKRANELLNRATDALVKSKFMLNRWKKMETAAKNVRFAMNLRLGCNMCGDAEI